MEQMASGTQHSPTHSVRKTADNIADSADTVDIAAIVDNRMQQKIQELESDLYTRLADRLDGRLDTRLGESAA
jgi:hypothetical protein